jgi:hypothetical protein
MGKNSYFPFIGGQHPTSFAPGVSKGLVMSITLARVFKSLQEGYHFIPSEFLIDSTQMMIGILLKSSTDVFVITFLGQAQKVHRPDGWRFD